MVTSYLLDGKNLQVGCLDASHHQDDIRYLFFFGGMIRKLNLHLPLLGGGNYTRYTGCLSGQREPTPKQLRPFARHLGWGKWPCGLRMTAQHDMHQPFRYFVDPCAS